MRFFKGTAADRAASDKTGESGDLVIESDTGKIAVADGSSTLGDLELLARASEVSAAQAAAATDATTKASAAQAAAVAAAATDATTKANAARAGAVTDVTADITGGTGPVATALSASTTELRAQRFTEISVLDPVYDTPQDAFDAAAVMSVFAAGVRIVFPAGTYAMTDSYVVKSTNLEVSARTARFEMGTPGSTASWGKPVFLDLRQNGGGDRNRYYVGDAEYVGARGGSGGAGVRSSAPYNWGCVLGMNGDNTYAELDKVTNFPNGGAFFSSWDGTSTYDRKGENNEIVIGEVTGYDFGFLWTAQKNLRITIKNAHGDIDDSGGMLWEPDTDYVVGQRRTNGAEIYVVVTAGTSASSGGPTGTGSGITDGTVVWDRTTGTNPTHVYYGSGTTTFRSEGVQIVRASAHDHQFGRPWCIKHADDVRRGPHFSDDTFGVEDIMSCHRFTQEVPVVATNVDLRTPAGVQQSGIYAVNWQVQDGVVGTVARLAPYIVMLSDDVDGGAISFIANEMRVQPGYVKVAHSATDNVALSDVRFAGTRGNWENPTVESTGAVHRYPVHIGYSSGSPIDAVDAHISNPRFIGHDKGIRVMTAGSTGAVVEYTPAAQRLTGTPSFLTNASGAATDWALIPWTNVQGSNLQTFTASGTYTVDASSKYVMFVGVGAGGGGGSGRRGADGTVRCGGGAGAGGARTVAVIPTALLASTVAVTVGAAGTGGLAVTTDDTNGNNGTAGGSTLFGTWARAQGGSAGLGGTATAGTGASGTSGGESGGAGGAASASGGAGGNGAVANGPAGGGAGGGITAANAASIGGTGGTAQSGNPSAAAVGVVDGTLPSAGTSQPDGSARPGNGGAGGSSSVTTAAQAGGAGGKYGGGGGGGGASKNGNNSGAGGPGAPGVAFIIAVY